MRISELSARTGVPASTLRFYESEGLLPADRAENGYRVYGEAAVDRLAFVAQAKHLDLPLPAVRELVSVWESEPCHSVRATYRPMLLERAAQVDERVVALEALRSTLAIAVERLDALPDRDDPCDAGCTFLDAPRTALPVVSAPSTPIACTLDGSDYGARVAHWHELLDAVPRVDVPGGVRVTLPTNVLQRATALAAAEQACCGFFAFRIDLHGSAFELTMTAPPDARPMLDDLLPAGSTSSTTRSGASRQTFAGRSRSASAPSARSRTRPGAVRKRPTASASWSRC
jgi:DNA-binding transcriptional MerR regulator